MGLFGMSEKARQKLVVKSAEASGTPQTDVVVGQRKFAMTTGAWILGAVFVTIGIFLAVALRTIPIPGVLVIIWFMSMTKPRRILAFGHGGYTNLAGSVWSTGPKEVIDSVPTIQFLGEKEVVIGDETLTLTNKEMEHLRQRMNSGVAPTNGPRSAEAPPFQGSALGQQLPPEPFQP